MKGSSVKVEERPLNAALKLEVGNAHAICFPSDAPYVPEKGWWWLAKEGDTLAGFAGLTPSARWADTGYLARAGVLPAYRGHGLQKRLIRVRLAKARKLGFKWVITDTRLNPASANSLIACGFRMYQPSDPWSFKDACYWRIKLND